MTTTKVHIAGALLGRVQRCERCHTRIDWNRVWPETWEPGAWQQGALIAASRSGAHVVSDAQAAAFRKCGPAALKVQTVQTAVGVHLAPDRKRSTYVQPRHIHSRLYRIRSPE